MSIGGVECGTKGEVELKQVYGLGLTLKNMNYGFKCSPGDSKA
jgi:hypothetical protein